MKKNFKTIGIILTSLFFLSCTSSDVANYVAAGAIAVSTLSDLAGSGNGTGNESTSGGKPTENATQADGNYKLGSFNMRSSEFANGEHEFKIVVPESEYYRATKFIIKKDYHVAHINTTYTSMSLTSYFSTKRDHSMKIDIYANVYDMDKLIADNIHISKKLDPYLNNVEFKGGYFKYSERKRVIPNQEILIIISNKDEVIWTNNIPLYNEMFKRKTQRASVQKTENNDETTYKKETYKSSPKSKARKSSVKRKPTTQNNKEQVKKPKQRQQRQ